MVDRLTHKAYYCKHEWQLISSKRDNRVGKKPIIFLPQMEQELNEKLGPKGKHNPNR